MRGKNSRNCGYKTNKMEIIWLQLYLYLREVCSQGGPQEVQPDASTGPAWDSDDYQKHVNPGYL